MDYWHDIHIEKSWEMLQKIKSRFDFILIGGWAAYMWAKTHKSKDIDIIVDFQTLSKLKSEFDLRKNPGLRKYEIKAGEIDIDVYVTFYSDLGIPLDKIESEMIEGFRVAKLEYLLALKQIAETERSHSEKGEKDRIDIMSLLINCDVDFKKYHSILKKNKKETLLRRLAETVKNFQDYKYLDMAPAELKRKKKAVLRMLSNITD